MVCAVGIPSRAPYGQRATVVVKPSDGQSYLIRVAPRAWQRAMPQVEVDRRAHPQALLPPVHLPTGALWHSLSEPPVVAMLRVVPMLALKHVRTPTRLPMVRNQRRCDAGEVKSRVNDHSQLPHTLPLRVCETMNIFIYLLCKQVYRDLPANPVR